MTVTTYPIKGDINKEGIEILAAIYKTLPLAVANLCDDHLDRSGALLGRVRDIHRYGEIRA